MISDSQEYQLGVALVTFRNQNAEEQRVALSEVGALVHKTVDARVVKRLNTHLRSPVFGSSTRNSAKFTRQGSFFVLGQLTLGDTKAE